MPRQCIITATGRGHAPGTLSVPPTNRVVAVVSYYTSQREVIEALIDLLLAKGVTPGEINLKLTNYLEKQNKANSVAGLGCCLYDQGGGGTTCCNLTQEQCDGLGGEFVAGGECQ
jgi:hypothetical protein